MTFASDEQQQRLTVQLASADISRRSQHLNKHLLRTPLQNASSGEIFRPQRAHFVRLAC